MWIVRWPIVLALFVYVIVCAGLAAGAAVDRLGLAPFENPAWRRFSEYAVNTTWLQTALCAGGAVLLFVAAVRLIRRTQAFWAWLIGFAMIGARWGLMWQADGGPSVEVRVQALFGLDRHPGFGRPAQPLLLKLTSPGGKPIQTTRDLPGFWRGSWRDVVRDMKGRYPKHRWPEEPWAEDPSLKTKNAFEASRRS